VKVKCSRYRPGVVQKVGRGIALLFHDRGTRTGEWSAARPGRTLPPGKTRYPFYRRLGGPQGRSGRAQMLVPTGIWSRTVQPVFSRYTDWATGPTVFSDTSAFIRYNESVGVGGRIELYVIITSERHMTPTYTRNLNLWHGYHTSTSRRWTAVGQYIRLIDMFY